MAAIEPTPVAPPPPDFSVWQFYTEDPSFLVLNVVVLVVFLTILLLIRRRYGKFFKIQREALDHRKSADAQALAQNQNFEQLIARQHATTNAHNQLVMAKAEEALRLNADTLAQIAAMNQTLTRIAERLEQAGGAAT